jgi:multimeric flavodoxin WrbA
MKKNILIINGSLGGENGNSNIVIDQVKLLLNKNEQIKIDEIFLNKGIDLSNLRNKLNWAHGFLFTSGTYWDSWGSPLQKFLEESTEFEATDTFFNKPASVIITMHSVGGKEVLSRLQGVLVTMGMSIPPMSGMVYALSTHLALKHESTFAFDFWSMDDIEIVLHNLITAVDKKDNFKKWEVDRKDPTRTWLK